MSPLPPTMECYRDQANIMNAYNIILRLEKTIQEMEKQMIYCRILGYLFHHFLGHQVNGDFVREISTISSDDEKLLELGQHFYQFFTRLYQIKGTLQETPQNHQTAKKLVRITHFSLPSLGMVTSVITKLYDRHAIKGSCDLREAAEREQARLVCTHCTHIFPESINANITSGSNKEHHAASVWAILDRFGYRRLREELNGPNIHRLENVMTMEANLHLLFDSLDICFAETMRIIFSLSCLRDSSKGPAL
ncbi:hypothetical protein F5J12DRAFT_928596 [Pisolithus orientalis]|uniref:uncharacterized protein n=1 Tax=Pisolithus orientalis TaxID=936130 RepID=UPI0022252343|nr:uncharacterized protein F5J12DRAFT_928596 [Pisolithus orientalis]KAI6000148.1 hypothetical protein F5J12DRAFT_928596 [Pisolithus orientalis]